MSTPEEKIYLTYDETYGKDLEQYLTVDKDGKSVVVNPKNPTKHESHHKLDQHPTVYYNLGTIISNPDDVAMSTSQAPAAIENAKTGKVYIYNAKNFINKLDIPGNSGYLSPHEVRVIIKYGEDGENYTTSYGIYNIYDE